MVQKSESQISTQQSGEDIRHLAALLREKRALLSSTSAEAAFPQIQRLVDLEIYRIRQKLFQDDFGIDLDLPAPEGEKVTLVEKLFLPCKKYPEVNFVGRIIGPRGSTAKQIEAATGCKVMIRGKGSMREGDRSPRGSKNAEHLEEDLHVLLHCEDTPNRARVRVAKAIDLINKISIPADNGPDDLKRKQLIELAILNGTYRDKSSPTEKSPTGRTVTPSSSGYRTHGSFGSVSPRNLSPMSDKGFSKIFGLPATPSFSSKDDASAWIWSQLGLNTPSPIGPPMRKFSTPVQRMDNTVFNFDLNL